MKIYDFISSIVGGDYDYLIEIPSLNVSFPFVSYLDHFKLDDILKDNNLDGNIEFCTFNICNYSKNGKPYYHIFLGGIDN